MPQQFQQRNEFVGVIYDGIEEIVIEVSPIIRRDWAEALADARQLVAVVNASAEAADDSSDGNTTVGRVDDSYCYVRCAWGIENEDDKADRQELAAMGRGPQDDSPSLPSVPAP